jgi:hypothetical protein
VFYAGIAAAFLLLLLTFLTYAYHLALIIAVTVIVLLGLLLVKKSDQQDIVSRFELNCHGLCSFSESNQFQLQQSSRLSFLGCWLVLKPIPAANAMFNVKNNDLNRVFFIYRDSLSKQDFSRIAHVISQLNHQ